MPRPKNLECKSQKRATEVAQRRTAKYDSLRSLEECTWETSSRGGLRKDNKNGCCLNDCKVNYCLPASEDNAELVQLLRQYYYGLSRTRKREFIGQRSVYTGYDSGGARSLRGVPLITFYLEGAPLMWKRLCQWQAEEDALLALPHPAANCLVPVCSRWFNFITGGHNDTKYQQTVRVRLGREHGLAAAQELDLNRRQIVLPKAFGSRICEKSVCSKNFLLSAKEHGLQLPNDAKVILPWKTAKAAHAAYV